MWLFSRCELQENVLVRMAEPDVAGILAPRSGQQRVNELFRRAQRRRVSRTVVATVAKQDDYMKRVRAGGGARDQLRPEGIVIFGDYAGDQALAGALGLPRPGPGEFVSARLTARPPRPGGADRTIRLEGTDWTLAGPDDPARTRTPPAPRLTRAAMATGSTEQSPHGFVAAARIWSHGRYEAADAADRAVDAGGPGRFAVALRRSRGAAGHPDAGSAVALRPAGGRAGPGVPGAGRFRGWSGGARDRFVIGAAEATPGYLPGEIEPGVWRVITGLYQVPLDGLDWEIVAQTASQAARGPNRRRILPRPSTGRSRARCPPARDGAGGPATCTRTRCTRTGC